MINSSQWARGGKCVFSEPSEICLAEIGKNEDRKKKKKVDTSGNDYLSSFSLPP